MPLIVTRPAGLALALALLAPAGCQMFGHPGPSAVAQGRYFSTGNADYDAFFVELHRLQVELKDAPDRVAEPRQALAKALDVGIDADVIKQALAKRASELGNKQVKLAVQRSAGSDKPVSLKVTGSPSGDDAELVKTLEDALATIGELETTIDGWKKSLDALPQEDSELQGRLDTAFAGKPPGTRMDVKNNLSDGQKLIPILVSRTSDAEHSNSELLDAVVAALGEAPANAEKASEAEPEHAPHASEKSEKAEKKAHKAPPPAPKPAKAPKAAPPPAPKPVAKAPAPKAEPKPAEAKAPPKQAPAPKADHSEVPPAPKPTQGTAKPDFEP